MRKVILVVAAALLSLGLEGVVPSPADAALEVSVSGSIRLNVIWSDRHFGQTQDAPAPTIFPFDSGPGRVPERDNSQTVIDARRTRLQIDMKDEVAGVKLAGRLQGDFDTNDGNARVSNSRHFRLRLAYGQGTTPAGFTIRFGQVRSIVSEYGDNLIGGVGVGGELNENGFFDQLQSRQPGIHVAWTGKMPVGDLTIGVGVEKQSTNNLGSAVVAEDQGEGQDVPMFGGGVRYRSPLFAVFGRGAIAKNRVILAGGDTASDTGWLGAIGADITPIPILRIYGQYHYSDGMSRHNGTFADIVCAAVCTDATLEGVKVEGWRAGVQLVPTKDLEFNAYYNRVKAKDELVRFVAAAARETTLRKAETVGANFIFKFWQRMDAGIEYNYIWIDSFGTSDGKANMVQGRMRFYF
jgi:hypothetical protein